MEQHLMQPPLITAAVPAQRSLDSVSVTKSMNPFEEVGPESCAQEALAYFLILGGSGALARKYLLPALFDIFAAGGLSPASLIVASDRAHLTRDTYRQQVLGDLRLGTRAGQERRIARMWPTFHEMLDYVAGDLTDRSTYLQLARRMHRPAGWQLIVYLAVPPELIAHVKAELANAGFSGSHTLVAVEKPFGPPPSTGRSGKFLSALELCHG